MAVEENIVLFVESRIIAEYGLESAIMEGLNFFCFFSEDGGSGGCGS